MKINAKTKVCIIIGNPIEHSLSPAMHNDAYQALGIDDQFVFVAANVKVENIEEAIKAIRVMSIRGLTCTIPHKQEILKYLDEIDPIAKQIGAVNTVVNDGKKLKGFNTDWLGAIRSLEKVTALKNKLVIILGAGGAARAMAFGVKQRGARIKILNRSIKKAQKLALEIGAEFGSLSNVNDIKQADIIMNATPIGMEKLIDKTPIETKYLKANQVVLDAVYTPHITRFLQEAKTKGAKIIPGIEMLLNQGTAQFELYTNYKAPEDVMRRSLLKNLGLGINKLC